MRIIIIIPPQAQQRESGALHKRSPGQQGSPLCHPVLSSLWVLIAMPHPVPPGPWPPFEGKSRRDPCLATGRDHRRLVPHGTHSRRLDDRGTRCRTQAAALVAHARVIIQSRCGRHEHLSRLTRNCRVLSTPGTSRLSHALRDDRRVESLRLANNGLGGDAVDAVAVMLQHREAPPPPHPIHHPSIHPSIWSLRAPWRQRAGRVTPLPPCVVACVL